MIPCHHHPYRPRVFPMPGEHINRWGMPTGRPHISRWSWARPSFTCRPITYRPWNWPRPRPIACVPLAPSRVSFVSTHRISPLVPIGATAMISGIATMILGICLPSPASIPVFLIGTGLFCGGAFASAYGSLKS